MIVGAAIRDVLLASAEVQALVGARIYPNKLPQGVTLPAVVFSVVDDVPQNAITGATADRLVETRLQVDCYSTSYVEAHTLAAAIDLVVTSLDRVDLAAWRLTSRDLYEDETRLHRVALDFSVWT